MRTRCANCDILMDMETWCFNDLCAACYEKLIFEREQEERKQNASS